ncbi:hypothetical protein HDU81_002235 [Chytriomyces hyalinus]|nr:hypothetical protein HDU81_002235 [Chytriomyces hyalinus]
MDQLAAEDYAVNMPGNKTSVGSVFTEKKRASVTGRSSKEKRNSVSGAPADLLWFRNAEPSDASLAKKKSNQSLGRRGSLKNANSALQSEQQAKVDINEPGGSGLHLPFSGSRDLSAASLGQMQRVSSHQSNVSIDAPGHKAGFVEIEVEEAGLKMPPPALYSVHQGTEETGHDYGLKVPNSTTSTKGSDVNKSKNSIETEGLKFPPTASQLSISVTPATLHPSERDSKADRRSASGSERRVKSFPVPPPQADRRRSSLESSKSTERKSTASSGKVGWNMVKATVAFHSALKSAEARVSSVAESRGSKGEGGEGVAVIQEETGMENDADKRRGSSSAHLDLPAKSSTSKFKGSQGSDLEEIKQAKAKLVNLKSEDQDNSLDSLMPATMGAKSKSVVITQPKVTPPQLPISEEFKNWHFTLTFLIPFYDNKGRVIDIDQFERKDIEDAVFSACGLHPRSLFMSCWDFGMSCEVSLCLSLME